MDTFGTSYARRLWWCACLALTGCGATGDYTWVDQVPAASFTMREAPQYVVAAGDLLNMRVYAQEALNVHARVRTDGKLTIPLVGDVAVAGKTTEQLSPLIAARLKDYVKDPSVSVTVEEIAPITVTVLGEVLKPGVFSMERRMGVLQAIASAGGPTDYASHNRVFLLRHSGASALLRIRFSYDALSRGEGRGPQFGLHGGDVVVVE